MGVIYKNGIAYGGGSSGGGAASDYTTLTNKPTLNGVTLAKDQTTADLKLSDGTTTYINDDNEIAVGMISNAQIQALFN
jgi:hypothetical protein